MHKELAEWIHPNSCSKWFNVQTEPGNEGAPQGFILTPTLFKIFIRDMDRRTELQPQQACR